MRAFFLSFALLAATNASAKQVETELGFSLVAGAMAGNVAAGTLWMGSPFKLRADWAAFIEEDMSKRFRIGLEVPLHERIALGFRPGFDFPVTIMGMPFCVGLGLRNYVTPYTLHGGEVQVSWRPSLIGKLQLDASFSATAFFFGNDLPANGALIEFQGGAGLRLPL